MFRLQPICRNIVPLLLAIAVLAGCRSTPASNPARPTATATTSLLSTVPPLSHLAGTPQPTYPPLPTQDLALIAAGEIVYNRHCAVCHGAALEGEPNWREPEPDGSWRAPPHDENGHTWHHSDQVLRQTIREGGARLPPDVGRSDMPAFGDVLSEQEIDAVLAYIKSHWPAEIRAIQWELTARDS